MTKSEPSDENEWHTLSFEHKYPRPSCPLIYVDRDSMEMVGRIVHGESESNLSRFMCAHKPEGGSTGESVWPDDPTVWLVLGAPGTESSHVVETLRRECNAVEISPEVAKRDPMFAQDYEEGEGSARLHRECCQIAETAMGVVMRKRRPFIHPMIGNEYQAVEVVVSMFRSVGYNVRPMLLDVCPDTALKRVTLHFYNTGCYVPLDFVFWGVANNPAKNYLRLFESGLVNEADWQAIDNETPNEGDPRRLTPDELRARIAASEKMATERAIAFLRERPLSEPARLHVARLIVETVPAKALREAQIPVDEIKAAMDLP